MNAPLSLMNSESAHGRSAQAGPRDECSRAASAEDIRVLSKIYNDDINIALWHRGDRCPDIEATRALIDVAPNLAVNSVTTPDKACADIERALPRQYSGTLVEDIAELSEMFCVLFDLKRVGLRLTALEKAMCPRFHVDAVPCRLVTTYCGQGTQWLHHASVDRSKLGRGSRGLPDSESGVYGQASDIQNAQSGDVALLKGEAWVGNEGVGLVHRSPAISHGEKRLLLTLDFAS